MSIPAFPEFRALALDDREKVERFFKKSPRETSDYSFPNLFIWRFYDHPKLSQLNGNLCILFDPTEGQPYFLPPVGEEKIEETIAACAGFLKQGPQFRMAPAKFGQAELDRDNADYCYKTADLIALKGRKYDGKRNWIRRFLAKYKPEYEKLSRDNYEECRALLARWGKTRVGPALKFELKAISEALKHWTELELVGRVIKVEGKVEAFMFSGELNLETAIVYIQVASRDLLGLPQYFHQVFAEREYAQYKYVNWEQDLGVPGLRKAKLSYQPCCLVNKYSVTLNG